MLGESGTSAIKTGLVVVIILMLFTTIGSCILFNNQLESRDKN